MTSLSQPVRVRNLTAWFILSSPENVGPARDYTVLEEAIEAASAVLHETGTVNELVIENTGDVDLFIQAGDIVKGGRQGRTIGADFIVPAKSGKIPLPTYCVEQSRWHRRRNESDVHFSKSKDFPASKKARLAMRLSKSQGEVCESVAEEQEQLLRAVRQEVRDAESPTSLQLAYECEGVTTAVVLEPALSAAGGDVVGVVWAINGVPSHADRYASPNLFAKLWRKLLRAAASGFAMSFSDEPFDGHDVELHWLRADEGSGNWYGGTIAGRRMEGWLCPALLLYFERAPRRIFVRCDPLPAGVNPIWTPRPGETSRRFVEPPQADLPIT